jgi:hypothetical protein
MWVLFILFKSGLQTKEALALMKKRTDKFKNVKGLDQKLWIHDEVSGELGGIYVFDSRDHLEAFQRSDLAKGIAGTYKLVGRPTRRVLKVTNVLFKAKPQTV